MTVSTELQETIFLLFRSMREKNGIKSEIANISIVQVQTLLFLAKKKVCSMKEIAEYLHIELPSATSLIDHLVDMKLVSRKQDKKDKRSVNISLTKKGKDILLREKKQRKNRIDILLKALSAIEKKQLLIILKKLAKSLEGFNEK